MAKRQKDPTYTALQVEAALCVWECLNEWTLGDDKAIAKLEKQAKKDPTGLAAIRLEWINLREDMGSGEMRSQSIVLGQWCLEVYDICTKHDPEFFSWWSYDWEVIPEILTHAVDKDGVISMYRGDYIYSGSGLVDPHTVAPFVAWHFLWLRFVEDCKHEAEKQWAYKDLVTDDWKSRHDYSGSRMLQSFEMGEEPAAFVKWLGEKYDLAAA